MSKKCSKIRALLGPFLENISMMECKRVLVDDLVKEKTRFYVRYVDDTL